MRSARPRLPRPAFLARPFPSHASKSDSTVCAVFTQNHTGVSFNRFACLDGWAQADADRQHSYFLAETLKYLYLLLAARLAHEVLSRIQQKLMNIIRKMTLENREWPRD